VRELNVYVNFNWWRISILFFDSKEKYVKESHPTMQSSGFPHSSIICGGFINSLALRQYKPLFPQIIPSLGCFVWDLKKIKSLI